MPGGMVVAVCCAAIAAGISTAQPAAMARPALAASAPGAGADFPDAQVTSDLPREQTAVLVGSLERLHREIEATLGELRPREPRRRQLLLFADRDDYTRTLREQHGVVALGTSGIFFSRDGVGYVAVWRGERPMRRVNAALQHEAFHAWAWSRFGGDLPVWVNEGLAMYFGEAVVGPRGRQLLVGQLSPRMVETVQEHVEHETYIPFREMLDIEMEGWMTRMREGHSAIAYYQAWSMVHFLMHGEGGRHAESFRRYLRLINTGLRSRDAFSRAFGDGNDRPALVDEFEAAWRRHVGRIRPDALLAAVERVEVLAAGAAALHERGIRPESLDELREALKAIDFSYSIVTHGITHTFTADDDSLFELPGRADQRENADQARLDVRPPDRRRMSRRERYLEDQHPSPPTIRTTGVRPADVEVRWRRDPEDPSRFSHEIVVVESR